MSEPTVQKLVPEERDRLLQALFPYNETDTTTVGFSLKSILVQSLLRIETDLAKVVFTTETDFLVVDCSCGNPIFLYSILSGVATRG